MQRTVNPLLVWTRGLSKESKVGVAGVVWGLTTGMGGAGGWLIEDAHDFTPGFVFGFASFGIAFAVYHLSAYLFAGGQPGSKPWASILLGLLFPVWFIGLYFSVMLPLRAIGPCNTTDPGPFWRAFPFVVAIVMCVASTWRLAHSVRLLGVTLVASGWYALLAATDFNGGEVLPRNMWVETAIWHGAYGGTVLGWSLLVRPFHGAGRCPTCGYELVGNRSGTCPECGTDVAEFLGMRG